MLWSMVPPLPSFNYLRRATGEMICAVTLPGKAGVVQLVGVEIKHAQGGTIRGC